MPWSATFQVAGVAASSRRLTSGRQDAARPAGWKPALQLCRPGWRPNRFLRKNGGMERPFGVMSAVKPGMGGRLGPLRRQAHEGGELLDELAEAGDDVRLFRHAVLDR